MRLISPFDPVIRDRKRALRLFGFDYAFEAFVPAPKRRFGYYVLPLLEGDRLVGRIDPKFERGRGELDVRRVWWEPGVRPTRARKRALAAAVDHFAEQMFIGEYPMTGWNFNAQFYAFLLHGQSNMSGAILNKVSGVQEPFNNSHLAGAEAVNIEQVVDHLQKAGAVIRCSVEV